MVDEETPQPRRRFQKVPIPYTRIRELNVWTLSNFLSLSRVLMLPFIYWAMFKRTDGGQMMAVGLMLAAVATDVLDGWIARKRHTISSFGKIIDPLADKICLGAIMLFLIQLRDFPVQVLVLLVARDLWILLGGALLIRTYKIVFPSNIWGKLYSFSVALLIAAYTLYWPALIVGRIRNTVLVLAAVSAFSYTLMVFRYVRKHREHQRRSRRLVETDDDSSDDPGRMSRSGTAAKV